MRRDVLLGWASAARRTVRHTARRRWSRALLRRVTDGQGRATTHHRLLTSDNDTLVAAGRVADRDIVIKMVRRGPAAPLLAHRADVLDDLIGTVAATPFGQLLPRVVHRGEAGGHAYVLESMLPGVPAARDGEIHAALPAVAAAAAGTVAALHGATARQASLDGVLERLVSEPITALGHLPGETRRRPRLIALGARLEAALRSSAPSGQGLTLAWTHGDLWLGNVLVEQVRGDPKIAGVIDWEDARSDGVPDIDLAHLWLTAQGGELGTRLLSALNGARDGCDRWLDAAGLPRPNRWIEPGNLLILAWLAHVHAGVRRCPPNGPGPVWRRRTVDAVLSPVVALVHPQDSGAWPW